MVGVLEAAGGTVTTGAGQTFSLTNGLDLLDGGVLRGSGQVTGNVTNTSGTVRPGTSPGTLTVTGNYTQGPGGTLAIDVEGTAQGTEYDHLAVSGVATLNGTLGVVQGAGFDPQLWDTFQFLTSGSRTGTFASLTGSDLPSAKSYSLDYPGSPDFGARLVVALPPGFVDPPTLTDTDPDSPANDNKPRIKGSAAGAQTVKIYKTADCSGPAVEVTAADFGSPGATVTVPDDTTTTFHATGVDDADNVSECSTSSITYVEESVPDPPTLTDTDPDSPANDNNPRIKGSAPGAQSVRVYKTADCSGPAVEVPAADFGSPGAPVTVPDNSTTTFHATSVDDADNVSECSTSSITYVEQSVPDPPTLTDTDPDSPANDNNPRIKGSAPGAQSVRVYKTADCSGPAVEVPAADFGSPGAPVTVPDNSTTTFHATSVDDADNVSECSTSSITYVHIATGPPRISIADVSEPEGDRRGEFALTVSLDRPAPAGGVSVDVRTADGTATAADNDYAPRSFRVSFAEGETSKPVFVPVIGDQIAEPDESFTVNLTNPQSGTIQDGQGVATIVNDDGPVPQISIDDVSEDEGNGRETDFVFALSLDHPAPAGGVRVDFATADGTATAADNDYFARSTRVTFAGGETSQPVVVRVRGDQIAEPDETLIANLSNPRGGTIQDGQGVATIVNDDGPVPQISIDDISEDESDRRNEFAFTISLDRPAPAGGVRVDYATSDGTATIADNDYAARSARISFAGGESSRRVFVPVLGDRIVEPDESFTVNLANPRGGTIQDGEGVGTILNDDLPPPLISIDDVSHNEGNSGFTDFTFTVSLDRPAPAGGVSVAFATDDGSAVSLGRNVDYRNNRGSLSFAPGEQQKQVTVQVVGDTRVEPDENFAVRLARPTGGTIGDDHGVGTIANDDAPPPPPALISIDDVSHNEGNSGFTDFTFTVSLDRPAPAGGVSVAFATDDGSAVSLGRNVDYRNNRGSLSFAPGEQQKQVTVQVVGDTRVEPDENFAVRLARPTGGTIGDDHGVGTIANDD